jgi:hypothetical protein
MNDRKRLGLVAFCLSDPALPRSYKSSKISARELCRIDCKVLVFWNSKVRSCFCHFIFRQGFLRTGIPGYETMSDPGWMTDGFLCTLSISFSCCQHVMSNKLPSPWQPWVAVRQIKVTTSHKFKQPCKFCTHSKFLIPWLIYCITMFYSQLLHVMQHQYHFWDGIPTAVGSFIIWKCQHIHTGSFFSNATIE